MLRLALLLTGLILINGCATSGRKIDQAKLSQIKTAQTTKQDVIKLIGSPDQITTDGFGNTTFMYQYVRASTKPASFIPIVGAFAGGVNVQNEFAIINIDSNGIVRNMITSLGANDTSVGLNADSKTNLDVVEQNKRPR
jgi:outer membrane protein assembly factor BamE (lipoprotein component of BamABCDE complex)